ncbi:MAG TPA: ATP-binding protein [Terriglobales bacterium]|nr:ATP-binding protein [Terriglobales bacterium]
MKQVLTKTQPSKVSPELELFRAALDASPHGIMLRKGEEDLYRNDAWERLTAPSEGRSDCPSAVRDIRRAGYVFNYNGENIEVTIAQDVTERISVEAQLREAQKLEALGRWVGGVVHDFNNLLTAIMLYSDLLAQHIPSSGAPAAYNQEVRMAVKRGTGLISQLLSFARQQQSEADVFSLNALIRAVRDVLQRMIGEDVEIVFQLSESPCGVKVVPSQIEQVLFNLALNSRDAMPTGGTLTIRTEERFSTTAEAQVALVILDTGCGMDKATLSRVFEPFFTTKPEGKGTGLGLTTVHSIVTQCGGSVCVESEPGKGTCVTVLLPSRELEPNPVTDEAVASDLPCGSESVLVVEDDSAVRESLREVLTTCGYDVLVAADGPQAIEVAEGLAHPVDLLITDLVLPGMSGRDVASQLRAANPDMVTLFISGYEQPQTAISAEHNVFSKPFSREALARKVRQELDLHKPGSVGQGNERTGGR